MSTLHPHLENNFNQMFQKGLIVDWPTGQMFLIINDKIKQIPTVNLQTQISNSLCSIEQKF